MIYTQDSSPLCKAVFVDGKLADKCFYADTKRGIARVFIYPFRIHKHGKRALSKTLRGTITVKVEV
jgi:hypothetical protein